MTVRELPADEWEKLLGLPIAENGLPDPASTRIIVAEDDGEIVGCWSFLLTTFLEGLWVDEAYRKGLTFGRLAGATLQLMAQEGIPQASTLVQSEEVERLALRLGFQPVEGKLMSLNFGQN